MDLPFNIIPYDEREKFESKVEATKKEKDLKGDDIKDILIGKISKTNLIYKEERSYDFEHPLDIAVGDERTLELVTFEVKGDTDNYSRLNDQIRRYMFVSDEFYLVVHKKKIPDYLADGVGVIRVFENGEVYIEKDSRITGFMNVSSDSESKTLFVKNGLGLSHKKTMEMLNLVNGIRKNLLFNRFFAVRDYGRTDSYKKYYPFDETQKNLIAGFDMPYQIKSINKDMRKVEKRIELLRTSLKISQMRLK